MTPDVGDKGELELHWARAEMDRLVLELGRLHALDASHAHREPALTECRASLEAVQVLINRHALK